ncbi:hypothetical protein E0H51_07140 [Rhizobium leguminosarum bv. viciae]|uniref:hypothetical protein n=1 Tax=Rhizobium leguminosarum TaxID=384 RepID=UPI001038B413|nr:hypothetical protein [Rhizobium leguminosarum]MBY5753701.1 hypothetical protein [Rhizobium leguminosarum]TBY78228.1 hypothetical protein E0H51_07140 [Rhizobium leguminosarum bv. viciae]
MLRGHPDLDLVLVMKIDDLKIALDDVRARQTALVNLIIFTDQKAMAVFRLYVTLGIAAGAAGAASFFRNDALLEFARWAMVATACWLALGALFCFRAMSRASINLPGRGPEFWQWAMRPENEPHEVAEAYLVELLDRQKVNRELNEKTAGALATAVKMGIATPLITAVAAAAVPLLSYL